MQSLLILGRQPALGLAELESLYGSAKVRPASATAATVDVDPAEIRFERLGGSTRLARLVAELNTTSWHEIEKYLLKVSPDHASMLPEGKLTIGISVYGIRVTPAAIQATGLSLKKAIRKTGRSVRLVPNKEPELNTAQVLHNSLTGDNGWELLLVRSGDKTLLAQTVSVQDIASYTIRDRERPKRDARVGMLPPKLAQIIINLGTGPDTESKPVVLDPFCGTGVVVQEALLDGYEAIGTDIEPRMVQYTKANVEWLTRTMPYAGSLQYIEAGDATSHIWHEAGSITTIACETYLGRPFTTLPNPEVLNQTVSECNLIIRKFLKNIGSQIKPGTRLCLAVPAWQIRKGQFKHVSLLDSLEEMGYNRMSFEHVRSEDLLYYREDQIVARELLVLTRK